jgi:hypothetical protein
MKTLRVIEAMLVPMLLLAGCGGSSDSSAADPAPLAVDCSRGTTACRKLSISGSVASTTPTFTGFADPALLQDPTRPGRVWMLYSWLSGKPATSAGGATVGVPHVATRLARSDDGGASWTHEAIVWDASLVADPEGLGPPSYFGSETPSLTAVADATGVTWYSVRLAYFLEPVTAYMPRFASSWVMRVAAARAPTPAALAGAPDAVLGTSTTAAAYAPHVRINALSPTLAGCAFFNNPAIFAQGDRLHVVAECLEYDGSVVSAARSRMVVLRTRPVGAPSAWTWEYVGVLADRALARELGGERLVSATISRAVDGTLLFTATPLAASNGVGTGCVAIELAALDPPAPRRNAAGALIVRARQTAAGDAGWHTGACTHDAGSATGIVSVAATTSSGLQAELLATGLRP